MTKVSFISPLFTPEGNIIDIRMSIILDFFPLQNKKILFLFVMSLKPLALTDIKEMLLFKVNIGKNKITNNQQWIIELKQQ